MKTETKFDKSFWSRRKILSYNPVMGIVVGYRSAGKTYQFKELALENFIKKKKQQFCYVRRYKGELNKNKGNLFSDIAFKYKKEVKCEGDKFYIRNMFNAQGKTRKENKLPWELFGWAIPLSLQQDYKSTPLEKVTTIIFDEVLISSKFKRYIAGEYRELMELYNTIDRDMNKTRLYLVSNSVSSNNPYFIMHNIQIRDFENTDFVKRNGGAIVYEMVDDERYRDVDIKEIRKHSWSASIAPDDYINYSIKNTFIEDTSDFIKEKDLKSLKRVMDITDGKSNFAIYRDDYYDDIHIVKIKEMKGGVSVNKRTPIPGVDYNGEYHRYLTNMYFKNRLSFNSIKTRENFNEAIL